MKIAVASGKGGTGKTTVAVALARVMGDCAFLDCDVEAPNSYLFLKPEIEGHETVKVMVPEVDESRCNGCGECSRVCQFNALAVLGTNVIVFPELCHGCGACSMVCEPKAITEGERETGEIEWGNAGDIVFYHGRLKVGEPMSPPLIRAVKEKGGSMMPETILDCPPGTTCPMIESIKDADYCVLVTEPTPFGLHDLAMAAGAVAELSIPAGVVINRQGIGDERVHRFCREKGLKILLEIPNSKRIAEAYASGKDMLDVFPHLADSVKMVIGMIKRREAA